MLAHLTVISPIAGTPSCYIEKKIVAQSCLTLLRPHGLYVAFQAPLSMEFSSQEYWRGYPFLSPGDLPDPGIKPRTPALQTDALPSESPGKPNFGKFLSQINVINLHLENLSHSVCPFFFQSYNKWMAINW